MDGYKHEKRRDRQKRHFLTSKIQHHTHLPYFGRGGCPFLHFKGGVGEVWGGGTITANSMGIFCWSFYLPVKNKKCNIVIWAKKIIWYFFVRNTYTSIIFWNFKYIFSNVWFFLLIILKLYWTIWYGILC